MDLTTRTLKDMKRRKKTSSKYIYRQASAHRAHIDKHYEKFKLYNDLLKEHNKTQVKTSKTGKRFTINKQNKNPFDFHINTDKRKSSKQRNINSLLQKLGRPFTHTAKSGRTYVINTHTKPIPKPRRKFTIKTR